LTSKPISERINPVQSRINNQQNQMKNKIKNLDEEELAILLEAASFSLKNHYEELAEYLDLSDDELEPLMTKLDLMLY
jgi:hypothetical protein